MKTLVLYYSMYGHVFQLAEAIASGAREISGNVVVMKTFPETLSDEILEKVGAKEAKKHFRSDPVASVDELPEYDTIIFGFPTRYGNPPAQVSSFIDATGGLWAGGKLIGKVASVFTSSATQHGGQESTILSFIPPILHLGMIYVGLPYSFAGQMILDEISGGSPYGISTIAGGKGERMPGENEVAGARFQGKHVASIGKKLVS